MAFYRISHSTSSPPRDGKRDAGLNAIYSKSAMSFSLKPTITDQLLNCLSATEDQVKGEVRTQDSTQDNNNDDDDAVHVPETHHYLIVYVPRKRRGKLDFALAVVESQSLAIERGAVNKHIVNYRKDHRTQWNPWTPLYVGRHWEAWWNSNCVRTTYDAVSEHEIRRRLVFLGKRMGNYSNPYISAISCVPFA